MDPALLGISLGLGALALIVVTAVLGVRLMRQSSGGVLPWQEEATYDPSLPPTGAGTPREWLAGRAPLGAGGRGVGEAVQARALFWEPSAQPSAHAFLRFTVAPAPDPAHLRKATRKALRAARRALPGSGGARIQARATQPPPGGAQRVELRLEVHGRANDIGAWLEKAKRAASEEMVQRLGARVD